MRRPLFLAALALAVVLPAAAFGAAKYVTEKDVVTATVHKTGVQGTALVYAGTVHSQVFGTGTVVEKVANLGLNGTFVNTYKYGTVKGTSTAHAKANPDGSGVTVTGTYQLTGGTGRYAHVYAKGTFTGTGSADLMTATFKQTGNVHGLPAAHFH